MRSSQAVKKHQAWKLTADAIVEDAGKTVAAQKMKGCCNSCSCRGTRKACRESDLAASEFSEEENEEYF